MREKEKWLVVWQEGSRGEPAGPPNYASLVKNLHHSYDYVQPNQYSPRDDRYARIVVLASSARDAKRQAIYYRNTHAARLRLEAAGPIIGAIEEAKGGKRELTSQGVGVSKEE